MSTPRSASSVLWMEQLASFLREQPGVEAVRLDPAGRRAEVATLGEIDERELGERLTAALRKVEESLAAREASLSEVAPAGLLLEKQGGSVVLKKPSCLTAPSFWKWREFAWPEEPAPTAEAEEHGPEWRMLAALAGTCGALGLLAWAGERWDLFPRPVVLALYVGALLAGGWDAAVDTWENLRERKLDIHFLMLAVAIGAACIGAWGEAALLLFLFSASGAMEDFALDRTHRAVDSLLKASPKSATLVLPNQVRREIAIEEVGVGDRLLVRPGDVFPADGEVAEGKSASDESNLTGESVPVEKSVGEAVYSGTLNLWGAVEILVRKLPSESTLQKIIRLIRTAQSQRAPSERFTDRFGGNYTLLVLGLTALMFFVWWLGFGLPAFRGAEGADSAFYRAMTLLVVASPCALVLSIPSAVLAAIARGARQGVLFKGGAAVENLAQVGAVALDKTGTLTTGELSLVGCESFPAGREREVLELAYALELRSQHPIARAIIAHGKRLGLTERDPEEFRSITGQGLRGRLGGATVLLGRRELLEGGPLAEWIRRVAPPGPETSEVWVVSETLIGRVLLRDTVRRESAGVLRELSARGLRTIMLTGDRRQTAEAVAREIGVEEVRAGLSPEQKVEALRELREGGVKVAMVGDGVNDAPSLAAADIAVAMGARGSGAALEQADVVLMNDRIEAFLEAHDLSRRARAIIRQNLVISLGTVALMVAAAIGGIVPLAAGVAAHEGSTVLVCLNSLRLLARSPRKRAAPGVT